MLNQYQSAFNVAGPNAAGLDLFNEVKGFVLDWSRETFLVAGPAREEASGKWEAGGEAVSLDEGEAGTTAYFSLRGQRAGWNLEFRLASSDAAVEAAVYLRAPEDDSRPAEAPRLLRQLLEKFDCNFEGEPISLQTEVVTEDAAQDFARRRVLATERRLPLVVIAGDANPDLDYRLQSRLAGIASVAFCSNAALNALNREMRPLHCSPGVVRLYMPGCNLGDEVYRHPFRWSIRLSKQEHFAAIRDDVLSFLSLRPQLTLFNNVVAGVQESRLSVVRSQVESDALEFLVNLEREWQEKIRTLESDNSALREQNNGLRRDKYILRQQINRREMAAYPDEDIAVDAPSFRTVTQVVDWAAATLEGLRFLRSARKSAAEAPQLPNLNRLKEVFMALSEYAGQHNNGPGIDRRQWFSDKGLDYAPHESKPTWDEYRKERTFRDEQMGEDVEMPAHFKVGGNQLRIHVRWQDAEKRWLIGHVGKHLPTANFDSQPFAGFA